jgi:phosphopantetheinyl transferase
MEIYIFDIHKINEINIENLPEAVLSHCKKKESFLAADALIRMGAENLHYGDKNKPLADNCYVSISHSGNMVAVCKSENPIGIDIEKIDYDRDLKKIAERFYHGKELECFRETPTAEMFFDIWTKKEAYSKISGEGVGEVFKGFDVFSLDGYTFETENVNGYMLSVCEKV